MKNKFSNKFYRLISLIIIITAIFNILQITYKINILQAIELDTELYNENDSNSNLYITAINTSSEIVKQQNGNPYEDKPYSDEYLKYISLSDEDKIQYGDAIPNQEFIAIHSSEEEENGIEDEKNSIDNEKIVNTMIKRIRAKSSKIIRSRRKFFTGRIAKFKRSI